MRIKVICLNCGYMSVDNKSNCEACGNLYTKVSFIDGKKLINMNGTQRIKWVEDKIGHPLKKR